MLPRRCVGHDLDDGRERRIRPGAVDRRVQIHAASQTRSAQVAVRQRDTRHFPDPLIDAATDPRDPRGAVCAAEHVPIDRDDHAAGPGIRKRRIDDVDFLLVKAIDAQRLIVGAGGQPIVEDAGAAA